jgi:acyl-CoA ligase (AMP-forming) (exosortase A-associated)
MSFLLHTLVAEQATAKPGNIALGYKDQTLSYAELDHAIRQLAAVLQQLDLAPGERVAIFLPKIPEAVISFFAATAAGGVFVPINPVLKAEQVCYILKDCNVRVLITQRTRYQGLRESLAHCHDLNQVVLVDASADAPVDGAHSFAQLMAQAPVYQPVAVIDADLAAILYTSGSTGQPKGVVLSHRNMVAGARSVASYLENTEDDRLLAVLPFSFDYGFSQLSTAFCVGASCYLLEYLLPRDIIKAIERWAITGLAAVPPLWVQLSELEWPDTATASLRYFTNSGGAMPTPTLAALRSRFAQASPYLMYGLTEAFRSSYLPPQEIDRRPTSMGTAIPNAQLMVVNEDGDLCAPHEPGELVHRGALVSLGYWGDAARTAERFKPAPLQSDGVVLEELAVWSGDTVTCDEDGYLYFVGRRDDMIKTSGYRLSPSELEEVIYASGLVGEVAAIGVAHPRLGQGIVAVVTPPVVGDLDKAGLAKHCRQQLPAYMVPLAWCEEVELQRNPNGKIDRKLLMQRYAKTFEDD